MLVQRDQAIIIGCNPGAENGKFLTFLTPSDGKVRLYYRRFPRRVRTEFLDPLQAGELLYSPATETTPGRLHSFHCEVVWPGIRKSLERLVQALHFMELTDLITGEGQALPGVFALLLSFLDRLEKEREPEALRAIFELRLMQKSGFSPCLEQCFSCRRPLPATEAAFSIRGGGVICRECQGRRDEPAVPISAGALSFMRKSLTLPENKVGRLRVGPALLEEVLRLLDMIVEDVLELQPSSTKFLKKIGAFLSGTIPRREDKGGKMAGKHSHGWKTKRGKNVSKDQAIGKRG